MAWRFIRTEKIISGVEITLGKCSYTYFCRVELFVPLNAKATGMMSEVWHGNKYDIWNKISVIFFTNYSALVQIFPHVFSVSNPNLDFIFLDLHAQ